MRKENFVIQGTILAVAGIIVRLIGILYRVPMTNIIGDEGMGYYSTAFNVYNIMLILSSYSLPLAVSKMVAARLAKGQYRNMNRVLRAALVYATVVGGLACFITWNFAGFFATTLFNTPFCVYALRTLGANDLDHGVSGRPARLFPGTWNDDSDGDLPDPGAGGQRDYQCGGSQRPFQGGTGYGEGIWERWICTGIWCGWRYDRYRKRRVCSPVICAGIVFTLPSDGKTAGSPRIGVAVWIPTVRFREPFSLPLFRLS